MSHSSNEPSAFVVLKDGVPQFYVHSRTIANNAVEGKDDMSVLQIPHGDNYGLTQCRAA